jgi:pyruvate/2-oxoglutarate dehydrogenase complex dihydrolipoamide acyltransferase (E2) component
MGGSITALLVYEVARLLRRYPILNAFCDVDSACLYEHVNVGVAVDSGQNLRVPVIHRADAKGLDAIAQDVQEKLLAYVEDRLTPEQVTGGTFTIADLSGEGVFLNHPLLNQDQSAILGVGSGRVWDDVDILNFTLAYDHRLTEGVTAMGFLRDLEHRLIGHYEALRQITGDASAGSEPACQRCFRGVAELERRNHFLVQTVGRDGHTSPICSSCLQGW